MMFHNSGGSRNNTLDSRQFHELDLTGQLLLDRPMLVADIDGAAADTFLGALSTPPHINQTTVLRVILPLQKP